MVVIGRRSYAGIAMLVVQVSGAGKFCCVWLFEDQWVWLVMVVTCSDSRVTHHAFTCMRK